MIPLDHTFGALVDTFNESNANAFIPDFWIREKNPLQNRRTSSALWWEWQDPDNTVLDAINKDGHLRIESVSKEGEYAVVLVKKGDLENGIPVGGYIWLVETPAG